MQYFLFTAQRCTGIATSKGQALRVLNVFFEKQAVFQCLDKKNITKTLTIVAIPEMARRYLKRKFCVLNKN